MGYLAQLKYSLQALIKQRDEAEKAGRRTEATNLNVGVKRFEEVIKEEESRAPQSFYGPKKGED